MSSYRILKIDKAYVPAKEKQGDETFLNGIFHFNISRILEDIHSGMLKIELEQIDVSKWFKRNCRGKINADHLPSVDVFRSVIQAEISAGFFVIIDGNHRIEKALIDKVSFIDTYKLKGEQLLSYFTNESGYKAFILYWNDKLGM